MKFHARYRCIKCQAIITLRRATVDKLTRRRSIGSHKQCRRLGGVHKVQSS